MHGSGVSEIDVFVEGFRWVTFAGDSLIMVFFLDGCHVASFPVCAFGGRALRGG